MYGEYPKSRGLPFGNLCHVEIATGQLKRVTNEEHVFFDLVGGVVIVSHHVADPFKIKAFPFGTFAGHGGAGPTGGDVTIETGIRQPTFEPNIKFLTVKLEALLLAIPGQNVPYAPHALVYLSFVQI
jgi:hypothetical protein